MKVLEYKEYLLDTYAPASVNSVLSSLNGFFDFCEAGAFKVKNLKIQRRIFLRKEKELTNNTTRIYTMDSAKYVENKYKDLDFCGVDGK